MTRKIDTTGWRIEFTPKTGVTIEPPAYAQWFRDEVRKMSPGKRKALLREKKPAFERMILRVMIERNLENDPIAATEWLHERLKTGEIKIEAKPVYHYPASFWRWLCPNENPERMIAAFERGYWSDAEARQLWRCLGRDDPMPKRIRFPEQAAAEIRKAMRLH